MVKVTGFAFIEFTAPDVTMIETLFESMGLERVLKFRKEEKVTSIYQRGEIRFLVVNGTPFVDEFADEHGPSACSFGFTVKDKTKAFNLLMENDAPNAETKNKHTALQGIGGSRIYLNESISKIAMDNKICLDFIDHITHNVYEGNMDHWADFYQKFFEFKELHFFDIKGEQTGLVSKAMGNGTIAIPINESSDEKSQINEYLRDYNGEGIQHIALHSSDIYTTVEMMRKKGIEFLDVPDTYYEVIDERIPEHGEDLERMKENKILIDGTKDKLLLQIFTKTCIGPIFFEIIQRKGNKGFGEGNFKALFESIELDQKRRGVLDD